MSKKIWMTMFTAVMIAVLGGAWLTMDAQAQGGGGRLMGWLKGRRPVIGQVTAISAGSISVNSLKGEALTFSIDTNTRFRSRDGGQGSDATIDDVKVGLWVTIVPERQGLAQNSGAKPAARAVILLPKDLDPSQAQLVRGRITSVDAAGSRFTVETRQGEPVTVLVDSSTIFKGQGTSLAELKAGMAAEVVTEKQANGDLLVYSVRAGYRLVRRAGEVVSVNAGANEFTLKLRRDGTQVTVKVDAETRFRTKGGAQASLADLKPGTQAAIRAQEQGAGSYLARGVVILPAK
jgi:hypothetical protein